MSARSVQVQVILAFFAIYILWGSTYLAIRVAVATVPPLFAAGVRFTLAGAVLYGWSRLRGTPAPSRLEWRNLWVLGVLMFLVSYSALFWAEETLPSGIASILVATIPTWTALLEIFVFKRQALRGIVVAGVASGLGGVTILAFDPSAGVTVLPALAVLVGVVGWSLGTVATTMMALPKSKVLSSGTQMLTGGMMLLACSALIGEMTPWPAVSAKAGAAILYLIVAGSVIAFTAYQWLLNRMPASAVTSYAYVNPVVALMIGYWMGGESIGARTVIGSALVLASTMALLVSGRSRQPTDRVAAFQVLPEAKAEGSGA